MANLHTENGVRSTAQDPGLFSQQIHSDLVSRIWLHEGQNVTKVVVSPSCTFIVLSATKQKNNFLCYDFVTSVRDCKADEGLFQHPVRRRKTAT